MKDFGREVVLCFFFVEEGERDIVIKNAKLLLFYLMGETSTFVVVE